MSRCFYAWFDRRDARKVASIEAALGERETSLVAFDPAELGNGDGMPLVVFLSDNFLTAAGAGFGPLVASWREPVVLVALGPLTLEVPEAVRRISWVRTDDDDSDDAVAGRIALSGRTTPRWLLDWQEVRVAADRVAAGDPAALLGQRQLDRALKTIARRPADILPEVPPEVRRLIGESRRAIRRHRRRRVAFAAAAAIVLAGVGLVALRQRDTATAARDRAESATRRAEADRLSRLAVQKLDVDPDLPVLLARRAYRLDPGPVARDSLRQALDAVPWHRSYRLAVAARQVAGSRHTPLVVVIGADGSATLLDSDNGNVLARQSRPSDAHGVPVVAISGDGRLAGLAYRDGLVEVRRLDPRFGLVWSRHSPGVAGSAPLSLAWMAEGQRLLTAWENRPASVLELPTGRTTRLPGGGIGAPRAVAVSADGKLVALSDRNDVAILRAATLRPCWSQVKQMPEAVTLAFDERQRILFVAKKGTVGLQIPIPASCGAGAVAEPETRAVISNYSDVATSLPGGGIATGSLTGNIALLEPPATYWAGHFRAHTAEVTGVAIANDALVTTGGERWLRVWRLPSRPVYPLGPARLVSFYENFGQADTRGTWRPMIASNAAGSRVTVGGLTSGSVTVLRADRLAEPIAAYFIAIGASIRPVGADPCAVLRFQGAATLYRCEGRRLRAVWSHRFAEAGEWLFESALSGDGRVVAVAGLRSLALSEVSDGSVRRIPLGDLKSLAFDRDDRLFAFEGDGTVLEVGPKGEAARRVAVPLDGCRLAVAGVLPASGHALLACVNGQVLVVDTANGSVVRRFRVGTDLSAAIGIRISPSGRLAAIVGSDGYRVVDVRRGRVVAAGGGIEGGGVGSEPRDAAFFDRMRSLLVLRADEGLTRVRLAPWRFLDGDALLRATAAAIPRPPRRGEVSTPRSAGA